MKKKAKNAKSYPGKKYREKEDDLQNIIVEEPRIPYRSFSKLNAAIPFTMQDWAKYLHLSERTLYRYNRDHLSFDELHSERIAEIYSLFRKGAEIFGSGDIYFTWLNTKSIALGGVVPKELFTSSRGINLVRDELSRIEHGILA